jgi:cation transport ATPase
LAASSTHALSAAIRRYVSERSGPLATPSLMELETRPGLGVVAKLNPSSGLVYLGSLALMDAAGLRRSPSMHEAITVICKASNPLACIGWDGLVRGVFSFRERFRDEAPGALDALREAGFRIVVLTGDYASRAAKLEQALGVSVEADLLPEKKLAAIRELRRKHGAVVMVGDGINDAPALAEADVGVAMGCGADVSREAADVCLLGDDLERIAWSIGLAKRTIRTVRQNLFWAFSYNAIGVALAAAGLLNPIWAAVAMAGSSLFVITNSLRLAGGNDLATVSPSHRVTDDPAPPVPVDSLRAPGRAQGVSPRSGADGILSKPLGPEPESISAAT